MEGGKTFTVPFAVHTAKYGYDWSSIPLGMTRADLDACYRRATAQKPEFMERGDVVSGVFAQGGRVVAFLVQIAANWDSNGRDAEYGAFAFLSATDVAGVDFRELLDRDEFRVPNRQPPASIRCDSTASVFVVSAQTMQEVNDLCRSRSLSAFDFSRIGGIIARFGAQCDLWFFCSVRTATGERMLATASPKPSGAVPPLRNVVGVAPAAERPAASVTRLDVEHRPYLGGELLRTPPRRSRVDWLAVLVWTVGVVVTAAAVAVWFRDSFFRG